MPAPPPPSRQPPSPADVPLRDRTSLIVRLGLVLLLAIGVVSVFGEHLMGLTADPGPAAPAGEPQRP